MTATTDPPKRYPSARIGEELPLPKSRVIPPSSPGFGCNSERSGRCVSSSPRSYDVSLRSGSIGPSWADGQVRGAVQEATRIWRQHNVQISMRGIEERSVDMPGLIGGIGAEESPRLPSRLNVAAPSRY